MYADSTMTQPKPWFKQFWPWVLIGIPGLTVVACMVTIYLAVTTADGLVQDDYYKEGLAINQTLAKDQKAAELELSAYVRIAGENLEAYFDSDHIQGELHLKLLHPTRAHQDQTLLLIPTEKGSYHAQLPAIAGGKWHVEITDDSGEWRIRGRMDYPAHRDVRLLPKV